MHFVYNTQTHTQNKHLYKLAKLKLRRQCSHPKNLTDDDPVLPPKWNSQSITKRKKFFFCLRINLLSTLDVGGGTHINILNLNYIKSKQPREWFCICFPVFILKWMCILVYERKKTRFFFWTCVEHLMVACKFSKLGDTTYKENARGCGFRRRESC